MKRNGQFKLFYALINDANDDTSKLIIEKGGKEAARNKNKTTGWNA